MVMGLGTEFSHTLRIDDTDGWDHARKRSRVCWPGLGSMVRRRMRNTHSDDFKDIPRKVAVLD